MVMGGRLFPISVSIEEEFGDKMREREMGVNVGRPTEENRREEEVLHRPVVLPDKGEVRSVELPGWREVWPVEPPRWRGGETEGPRRRQPPVTGLEVSGGRLTFSLLSQPRLQVEFDLPRDSIRDALEVGLFSAAVMFFYYKFIRWNHEADGPRRSTLLAGRGGGAPGSGEGGGAPGDGDGKPPVDDAPGIGGGGALGLGGTFRIMEISHNPFSYK